jgi:hypothetical protein
MQGQVVTFDKEARMRYVWEGKFYSWM